MKENVVYVFFMVASKVSLKIVVNPNMVQEFTGEESLMLEQPVNSFNFIGDFQLPDPTEAETHLALLLLFLLLDCMVGSFHREYSVTSPLPIEPIIKHAT